MRRIISGILAIAALLTASTPALADGHRHGGGNGTTTAILSGVAGLAVGALATSVINHRSRASQQSYQSGYPTTTYQQAYPTQTYQQPTYAQPAYAPQSAYQQQGYASGGYASDQAGYSGYDQGYVAPPVARRHVRPAPNGVRCLTWNGEAYVPMRC